MRYFFALCVMMGLMAAPAVVVAAEGYAPLTGNARAKAITRVETYLSAIPTATAQFTQRAGDGSTETGMFYLKRPGKLRWQYNPPSALLLVSNGSTMTYYDPGLQQVNYVAVDDTLAGFIAQKTIALEGATTELRAVEGTQAGDVRVTVTRRKKPSEGSLTLGFSGKPFALTHLVTVDASGNRIEIALSSVRIGPSLEDGLFVFNDPRSINDRRNKKR